MKTPKGHSIFRFEIDEEYNEYSVFEIDKFEGRTNSYGITNCGMFCYCDILAKNIEHAKERMYRKIVKNLGYKWYFNTKRIKRLVEGK